MGYIIPAMPAENTTRRTVLLVSVAAALLLLAAGVAIYAFRSDEQPVSHPIDATPRPPRETPRRLMWDLWHAAMTGDRDAVRAAFHAPSAAEQRAADAMAELLIAEAAFARQLRHTWPLSPTSRDGAGTWFSEGGDAALLIAPEQIDPGAVDATVSMHGTPVKLTRAAGAWKIVTADLVRTRLKRDADADADLDLATAAAHLSAMARTYHDLRAEIAALRLPSPSAAVEKLRQSMPPPNTQLP